MSVVGLMFLMVKLKKNVWLYPRMMDVAGDMLSNPTDMFKAEIGRRNREYRYFQSVKVYLLEYASWSKI